MFRRLIATLVSLFNEIMGIQPHLDELDRIRKQIDGSARRIVEGIAKWIDVENDEVLSSREALEGRDLSWYEEVASAVVSDGFSRPVAYEPSSWMSRPMESRSISEYALGDGGAIVASWFVTAASEKSPERRIVTLFTEFADGRTLVTVAGGTPWWLPLLETERLEWHAEGTPVAELLRLHRAEIAVCNGTARRFNSIGELHASQKKRDAARKAYRRSLGLSLVEQFIEARFTGDRAKVGAAYLETIRRHPDWYKYASGNT